MNTKQDGSKMKSLYDTSDHLHLRHPYNQKSFEQELKDDEDKVFNGFGVASLERNINALKSETFPLEEKKKALKILFANLCSQESRLQAVRKYNIVSSLVFLLKQNINEEMNELASKIVEQINNVNEGKKLFFESDGIPLLLNVVLNNNSTSQKDRCAACSALYQISRSFEGQQLILKGSRSPSHANKSLDVLISILETDKSNASEKLLLLALETLAQLSSIPAGRHYASEKNTLLHLHTLFTSKFQFLPTNNPLMDSSPQQKQALDCIKAACRLVWNLTLDGPGKKLSKDQITLTLVLVLQNAIEASNLDVIQLCTGAFTSILVYEEAKKLSTQGIDTTAGKKDLIQVLCDLLMQIKYATNPLLKHSKLTPQIDKYVVDSLQLACEFPEARSRTSKLLEQDQELMKKVFSNTKLFFPVASSTPDLLPEKLSFIYE